MKTNGPRSMAGALADEFRRAATRTRAGAGAEITFHDFLLSPDFAAPYFAASRVTPSPVVLAIAQASEGLPVTTIDEATAEAIFGCGLEGLPRVARRTVVVGAGRGGGKTSSLLAPKAVHAMWTCPLPHTKPGERPRATVIAPDTDEAEQAFNYALGLVRASPVLSAHIVEGPGGTNTEQIVLRRVDGREVEFVVSAARKGGTSVRGPSVIFCGLDEGAFFQGEGFAINDRAIYEAAIGGATGRELAMQLWIVSSPWVEGEGLMEELIRDNRGHHTNALVASRVSTYLLKGIPDDGHLAEGLDQDAYQREILAIALPAGSRQFFPLADLLRAAERLPPVASPAERGAGIDLAHTRDNSALVIGERHLGGIFVPRSIREVVSAPDQKPSDTYRLFTAALSGAGIQRVAGDSQFKATLREHTDPAGVRFVDAPAFVEPFLAARKLFQEDRVALAHLSPPVRERLMAQFKTVMAVEPRERPGHVRIILARKKGAQGHADAAAAFVLMLWVVGSADPQRWGRVVDAAAADGWRPPARERPRRRVAPPTRKGALNRYLAAARRG